MGSDQYNRLTQAGGTSLATGSAIFIITITSFVFLFGSPEPTGEGGVVTTADQARHLLANSGIARAIWIGEALAVTMFALAGFALSRRQTASGSLAGFGWLAVGVGSIVYLAMYGILLGAYWPAARAADSMPEILDAANETAVAIFLLSNVIINVGLAIAFFSEPRLAVPVLPRWLAWLSAAMASVAACVSGYALITEGGMETALKAAPIGGLLFVLMVFYGVRLARRSRFAIES